jgi:hypothetical protein
VSGRQHRRRRSAEALVQRPVLPYLDGIDTAEIIDTVHNRRPPMISASAGLMI